MRPFLYVFLLCSSIALSGCGHNAPAPHASVADAPARANISAYQQHRHGAGKPATQPTTTP